MEIRTGTMLACAALLALMPGCKKKLSPSGVAWLGAIEHALDHGVSLAVAVCKPDRGDAMAWSAQSTATGYKLLLGELATCASAEACTKPVLSAAGTETEAHLDDDARKYVVSARETLGELLSASTTSAKTRAQAAAVLTHATATAEASGKLVRVCGSPSRQYDMSQAMLSLEQTRVSFRASIKAMQSDP